MTCAGEAGSMEEAFALTREQLSCAPDRFDVRGPFVRSSTQLKTPLDSGLAWQTNAANFRSMLVRFTYADGRSRLVDVDPQMTARNWFPGNRFSVPVPSSQADLVAIDAVVERPFTRSVAGAARLTSLADSERELYSRSLAYMFMFGLLILPLLYDGLFYRVLRQGFVLWHFLMVATTSLFMLFSSGLVNEILPDIPLDLRWRLTSLFQALSAGCGAMVIAGLIEKRFLPPRLTMAMMVSALLPLIVKFIATFGGELTRITINNWFVFSFAPVVILISIVVAVALSRGSRGARWALAAMSGLMLVVAWRTVVAFSGSSLPFPINDMVFAGFVLLSLVTAIAVGDRFTGLKHEHDEAQMRAIRMGQMANTDGLTGLANRRAFDMVRTLKTGQGLLVADIDHFKQVNDREGHQVGDAVLCNVAGLLKGHLPAMDGREDDGSPGCVYRLGGEEFAAIVEVMEDHQLIALADRLREIVGRSGVEEGTAGLPQVTISLGVVLGRGQMMHEAFGAADRALYRAKREGRNCVRIGDADDCNADARVSQGSTNFGRAGA
ncbi:diguanylate cyclase [Erythrobacter sp. A6_0]|uniref:sensor domain-containing diguanylate cyclase n=1 Tax=Erythrobacter sp. A6_0 TaxID=2821089 RepID=UPI001ADB65E5|nr:diguanylate cyclase [Erythrobacter sp. A6_0]MBO9510371.1 diguanylate cyclase [Erythrobacter sp. A6_0]